jgi:hypothetical protein
MIFQKIIIDMRQKECLVLVVFFLTLVLPAFGQNRFNDCTAAFLDGKLVVDEYTTTGKCSLPAGAAGVLTVCTADLSPDTSIAVDRVPFMIAIRDGRSGTLVAYSEK